MASPETLLFSTTSDTKVRILQEVLEDHGSPLRVEKISANADLDERELEKLFSEAAPGFFDLSAQRIATAKVEAALPFTIANPDHRQKPIWGVDIGKRIRDHQEILGKPETPEEAVDQILYQSGRDVVQMAGAVLFSNGLYCFADIRTYLRVNEITEEQAKRYVWGNLDESLSSAGAIAAYNRQTTEMFYQGNYANAVMRCYRQVKINNGSPIDSSSTTLIQKTETQRLIPLHDPGLVHAVYGCPPAVLKEMGLIKNGKVR